MDEPNEGVQYPVRTLHSVSVEKFATGPKIFLSMKTVFGHMIVPPNETLDLQWFKGQIGGHEFRVR